MFCCDKAIQTVKVLKYVRIVFITKQENARV